MIDYCMFLFWIILLAIIVRRHNFECNFLVCACRQIFLSSGLFMRNCEFFFFGATSGLFMMNCGFFRV